MSAAFWNAVLALYGDIDRSMAARRQAVEAGQDGCPYEEQLRASLKARLLALTGQLGSGTVAADDLAEVARRNDGTGRLLRALIYACDERVLHQLLVAERLGWQLLQLELLGVRSGGELFYQLVDEAVTAVTVDSLLPEVLYFCLSNGFTGRHGGDPGAIEAQQARLRDRLDAVAPAGSGGSGAGGSGSGSGASVPAIVYYLCAAAVTVLCVLGLSVLTNL